MENAPQRTAAQRHATPRPDQPIAGFYKLRLVKRGPHVPAIIWWGQPIVDGETLDRSWRWCVCLNDETCQDDNGTRVPIDVFRVWPECSGQPITQAEYEFMVKRVRWAREHAPQSPYANPYEPIELGALPPVTP